MSDAEAPKKGFILSRFNALKTYRESYLTRGYKYSKITIPSLLPEEEDSSTTELLLDYSTVGAEYVNHLANKYVSVMFPVHRCFFKLQLPAEQMIAESQKSGMAPAELEQLFSVTEREARRVLEKKHARVAVLDAMKHLVVTGNSLIYMLPDEELVQNYALDEYVLFRDQSGRTLEIITEDKKSVYSLPDELREEVINSLDDIDEKTDLNEYNVKILTYVRVNPDDPKTYLVNQSVEGIPIGVTEKYTKDLLPWIPCVWQRTRREHYGRGLVEDHYGAFYALSILMEALVAAGIIMTDFKFLVKPGSILDIVRMNSAATGTYHYGNPDDVAMVDHGQKNDMQFVTGLVDEYRKALGKVFLVLSSQIRDSERTTAEENRMRAAELDTAHGGVFGNLALTLQTPMSTLLLRDLDVLIAGSGIEPVILTGIDAMGRASENEKYAYLFEDLSRLQNVPEEFRAWFKGGDLLTKLSTGRDVDASVIKTSEEFQADQQAAMEQQAQMQAGESMIDKAEPEQIAEAMQE